TGPAISGYLAAIVVLSLVVLVRDVALGHSHGRARSRTVGPGLLFGGSFLVLYVAYRSAMPAQPRHRLVFDLVFLLLVLGVTLSYAVADHRRSDRTEDV